jgi:hypothetical protein
VIIAAEMIAAKLFNEREGNALNTIYGAVTTGTTGTFLNTKAVLFIDIPHIDHLTS